MKDVLTRINKINGVRGTLMIEEDGLVIASDVRDEEDTNTLAAMTATITSTLRTALTRMNEGSLNRFVLNGTTGSIVALVVGSAILLTLVRKDANMGMVLVELKEAAQQLQV